MTGMDAITTVVTMGASALGAALGAWLALHNRVSALEHQIWGVKGTNGLTTEVKGIRADLIAILREERSAVARIDRRNQHQHPDDDLD